MTAVTVNQGAAIAAPSVEKKPGITFFQAIVLAVVIFVGTGYVIDKMHPRTPIKNAIAGIIRMIPFLAPFVLLDDGQPMTEAENCECECLPDGTAKAVVDGKTVDAMNHEFGG